MIVLKVSDKATDITTGISKIVYSITYKFPLSPEGIRYSTFYVQRTAYRQILQKKFNTRTIMAHLSGSSLKTFARGPSFSTATLVSVDNINKEVGQNMIRKIINKS